MSLIPDWGTKIPHANPGVHYSQKKKYCVTLGTSHLTLFPMAEMGKLPSHPKLVHLITVSETGYMILPVLTVRRWV